MPARPTTPTYVPYWRPLETSIAPKATDEGHVPPSGDEDEIARRFAVVMVACETLFRVLAGQGTADARPCTAG